MNSDSSAGGLDWFDCNARIGPCSAPRPEYVTDTAELLDVYDQIGIGRGLVYHSFAWEWHAPAGNERLLTEIAGEDRLSPCLVALPPATREMGPIEDFAARVRKLQGAVRIFPAKHNWRLTEWGSGALFDALNEAEVPVLLDFPETNWDEVAWLLEAHPRMPLILIGTGYRVARYIYPLMERHENFHVEGNTYTPFRGVEDFVELFGARRLVFGTGLPDLDPGGPIASIAYAEIAAEDKALMASGNLVRLLTGERE